MYVKDIVITGKDVTKISLIKDTYSAIFKPETLTVEICFLAIEVTQSREGVLISHKSMLLTFWRQV